ncbi:MAG: hypothetical protein ABF532_06985 [Bifidobacterium sp.]|nr:hypothetical protein [Bifidobacterium tibiigranuli]
MAGYERCRTPGFNDDEGCEPSRRDNERGEHLRGIPTFHIRFDKPEDKRGQAQPKQDCARNIERSFDAGTTACEPNQRKNQAGDANGNIDDEDGPPAEHVREAAADQRPDCGGQPDGCAEQPDSTVQLGTGERATQHGQPDAQQQRTADSLYGTGGDKHADAGCQAACQGTESEYDQSGAEQSRLPIAVASRASQQEEGSQGEQVGVDDPLELA